MNHQIFLNDLGIINPLGAGKDEVAQNLFAGQQTGMIRRNDLIPDRSVYVGAVLDTLPEIPDKFSLYNSRNNQLFLASLLEIIDSINSAVERYGRDRIAVILGTSTSGLSNGEQGVFEKVHKGRFPTKYDYAHQDPGNLSAFVAEYLGLTGLSLTVSTACTSSIKALASARRFINAGICDAAIVGGADTICAFTTNGFHSLDAVSDNICNPLSRNRDGINIGEGSAVFLVSKEPGAAMVSGIGESSDAHHISAPDPEGKGACMAMEAALSQAKIKPNDIGYVNLHGTATPLNDAMEAKAIDSIFSHQIPCSSTKPMTGHMLGATGCNELGFLWLALQDKYSQGLLPPHIWDNVRDPELPPLNLVERGDKIDPDCPFMMSNSFAFGGNNLSVIIGKGKA